MGRGEGSLGERAWQVGINTKVMAEGKEVEGVKQEVRAKPRADLTLRNVTVMG